MNGVNLLPCQWEMIKQINTIEGRMQEMNQNSMKGQMVDRPGAGKSYAMLHIIKNDDNNQQKKQNIIICPFTILKQWTKYIKNYNLKYCVLQYNDTQNFKTEDYDGYDIILIQDIVFRYFALNVDKNLTDDQSNTIFKIRNNVFRRIVIDEYDSIQFCIGDYYKLVKSDFVWFISATLNLSKNFSTTEFHGKVQCSEQLINQSFNSLPQVNYVNYLIQNDIINTIFESNQLQDHVSSQIACLEYQYFQKKYSVNLISVNDMCKYFTINLFEELQKSYVSVMYEISRAMKDGLSLYQYNDKLQEYIQEQEYGIIRDINYIQKLYQFLQDIIKQCGQCNQEIQQAIKQKKFTKKDINDLQFFDLECIQQQLIELENQTEIVNSIVRKLQQNHCSNCYTQYNDQCNMKLELRCCGSKICLQCIIELSQKYKDIFEEKVEMVQCPVCLKGNQKFSQIINQDNKALQDMLKTKNKDKKTQKDFYRNFRKLKQQKEQLHQKQINQQVKNQIFSKQNKSGQIQFQNVTKQQVILSIIDNIYNQDSRILIFCDYQSPFQDLSNYFQEIDIPYQYISGTDMEVKQVVEDFEKGRYKILLIDSLHFGVGLNLQVSSDIIIMNDSTRFYQIVGRAQRIGRQNKLNVHKVFYNNEYQNTNTATQCNQNKSQQSTDRGGSTL